MEIKYFAYIPAGAVICLIILLLFIFFKARARGFESGIKVANIDLLKYDSYIKGRIIAYKVLRICLIAAIIIAIMSCFILLARPYSIKKTNEQQYNRDIMLCIDVSASVDELNKKLVKDMQKIVKELSGERIGIVIFNTTPVLLVPLTDDYEYVIEQLENIGKAIRMMADKNGFVDAAEWLYWNNYLYGGTLIGNELRGSSLIGDGLLGGLFGFPEESTDRTRVIIFSTDNEKNGDGYVTLTEAADYCRKNEVYVYGIGTKSMYQDDMDEMRAAVIKTNGKFYLEESSFTFHNIVDDISSLSASLTDGRTIITMTDSPQKIYIILCVCFVLIIIISIILKRVNVFFIIMQAVTAALLAASFLLVIKAPGNLSNGFKPDINIESSLNVIFVVDDTISMLADDAGDGAERLTRVKDDCNKIIDELDGANFSVISFNNESHILTPINNNSTHVKSIINAIYPIESLYAKGSSLNTPKAAMLAALEKIQSKNDNKTALFFISDGEITDGSALESYSELSKYVDFGAVLGYGTSKGGEMTVDNFLGEPEIIMDYDSYPFEPALSRINEENLRKIADDLNISYINMTSDKNIGSIISDIKANTKTEITEAKKDSGDNSEITVELPENKWYMLFLIVAGLMMCNAGYCIVKK